MIEPVLNGDQLETNVSAIERAIDEVGRERLVAVVTSTSCFAPARATTSKSWRDCVETKTSVTSSITRTGCRVKSYARA